MNKIKFNPAEFSQALNIIDKYNRCDLSNVQIFNGENWEDIPIKILESFKYTGLSNKTFFELELWKLENWAVAHYCLSAL